MAGQLFTLHSLATHLSVSDKTLLRLIAENPDFPRPITVRRQPRWLPDDVFEWERWERFKARLPAEVRTILDNAGQSRTSDAPGDLPPSQREKRK